MGDIVIIIIAVPEIIMTTMSPIDWGLGLVAKN